MKKYFSLNTIAYVAITIVVTIVILLLMIGAWHAQANVEDLELAIAPRAIGKWKAFLHLATTYDGRFSTNFLHGFNPLVWNAVKGYKIMIFIALLSCFLASYWFSNTWLVVKKLKTKILVAFLFVASMFLLSPNLAHHLYWMGSSFVYFYPCFFFLLFASAMILYLNSSERNQFKWFTLSAILLFIGLGFSELFLPFYLLFFTGLLTYLFFENRELMFRVLPLAIWGVMIIIFVLATPAVGFRFDTDPAESAISMAVFWEALLSYGFILKNSFLSWPSLFIFLAAIFIYNNNDIALRFELSSKSVLWFIGALFILPFLMTIPFFLIKISSDDFPYRIYIPTLFIQLLILLFVLIPYGINQLKSRKNVLQQSLLAIATTLVSILLLLNIHFGNNAMGLLYTDFASGKLSTFNKFMNERYALLQTESKVAQEYIYVCTKELEDYPRSIYTHPDIENNRRLSKWNKFIEGYFGLDQVAVPGDNTQKFNIQ